MESINRNSLDQSDELGNNSEDSPAKKQKVAQDVDDAGSSVSQATAISDVQLNARVLSLMQCPVCRDTCLPPIFTCRHGHIACEKCQPLLKECGVCRTHLPLRRCVQLEKIAEQLMYPCPNKSKGCTLVLFCSEMCEHIPKCEYGLKCFLCGTWKGQGNDLRTHVLTMHPKSCNAIPSTGFIVMKAMLTKSRDFNVLFYNDDFFWSESFFCSGTNTFSLSVRIASHDVEKASRYVCGIEFKAKNLKNSFHAFSQGNVLTMNGDEAGSLRVVLSNNLIYSYEGDKIEYTLQISVK